MIRSLLIGMVAGMRSMTPLAVVSAAARGTRLPADSGVRSLIANPTMTATLTVLAVAEALGDKLPQAPDRIVPLGIAARIVTGGLAGAALAPRNQRHAAAALGALGAVAAAYVTFNGRVRAMRRFGQVPTGIIEDAIALGGALWLARINPS